MSDNDLILAFGDFLETLVAEGAKLDKAHERCEELLAIAAEELEQEQP